jgi:hypothetical protein
MINGDPTKKLQTYLGLGVVHRVDARIEKVGQSKRLVVTEIRYYVRPTWEANHTHVTDTTGDGVSDMGLQKI